MSSSRPVAIGGVGGSGTRLIAALAIALGLRPGSDRNGAEDNLWYTLLFKHAEVLALAPAAFAARASIFVAAMSGRRALRDDERALVQSLVGDDRPQHPRAWLQARADSLCAATFVAQPAARWAWKEPNTHIELPRWRAFVPGLRYVHVVRNGLDMAFSANQNQRALWGPRLLGREPADTPRDALAYWVAVHRRIRALGAQNSADFLWLDYDALCDQPESGLRTLAEFLEVSVDAARGLRHLVEARSSRGRGRETDLAQFDPADLAFLRNIGHL